MNKPRLIEYRDVFAVMDHAKKYLGATPASARIRGSAALLTPGERLALAYMNATLTVLNGMGVDTTHLKISFDDAEHDPL